MRDETCLLNFLSEKKFTVDSSESKISEHLIILHVHELGKLRTAIKRIFAHAF